MTNSWLETVEQPKKSKRIGNLSERVLQIVVDRENYYLIFTFFSFYWLSILQHCKLGMFAGIATFLAWAFQVTQSMRLKNQLQNAYKDVQSVEKKMTEAI